MPLGYRRLGTRDGRTLYMGKGREANLILVDRETGDTLAVTRYDRRHPRADYGPWEAVADALAGRSSAAHTAPPEPGPRRRSRVEVEREERAAQTRAEDEARVRARAEQVRQARLFEGLHDDNASYRLDQRLADLQRTIETTRQREQSRRGRK